ncbi:MAG: hypothetical protein M0P23_08860 [Bacteroidales bacterium]|nr:hypothetical protein [Bacteroidales bacterium]
MKRLRKEEDVIKDLQKQGRYYQYRNPTLEQAKEEKYNQIEAERFNRMKLMTFTIPSTNIQVEVKIAEQPPSKPRQTWLAAASTRAIAAKIKSIPFADELIAADNSRYLMDQDDWIAFSAELHQLVKDYIDAANQHIINIQGYNTVEEVRGHDLTLYWP